MNNYIDEKLIHNDIENPVMHLEHLLDSLLNSLSGKADANVNKKELIRAFHIINSFCNTYELEEISFSNIGLTATLSQFRQNATQRLNKIVMTDQKTMYVDLFKKPENSMSDEDYEQIQNMINSLKVKLKKATDFDKDLQRRVLDKINKLQSEIDKDISSLELAKGRLITIADTLSYVHNKALKPIKDSTIEIINTIRGIEAKNNGVSVNNQIEYQEEIEDVEVVETNQLEE